MSQSCGSLIGTIYDSSNSTTSDASTLFSTFIGGILWLMLKPLKRWRSPALRSCNSSSRYSRLDTSTGWGIISCPGSYWVASSPLAIVTEENQRNDSRTAWKNPLMLVTSNIDDSPLKLRTEIPGVLVLKEKPQYNAIKPWADF